MYKAFQRNIISVPPSRVCLLARTRKNVCEEETQTNKVQKAKLESSFLPLTFTRANNETVFSNMKGVSRVPLLMHSTASANSQQVATLQPAISSSVLLNGE